jgi:hypothetical protein
LLWVSESCPVCLLLSVAAVEPYQLRALLRLCCLRLEALQVCFTEGVLLVHGLQTRQVLLLLLLVLLLLLLLLCVLGRVT